MLTVGQIKQLQNIQLAAKTIIDISDRVRFESLTPETISNMRNAINNMQIEIFTLTGEINPEEQNPQACQLKGCG